MARGLGGLKRNGAFVLIIVALLALGGLFAWGIVTVRISALGGGAWLWADTTVPLIRLSLPCSPLRSSTTQKKSRRRLWSQQLLPPGLLEQPASRRCRSGWMSWQPRCSSSRPGLNSC